LCRHKKLLEKPVLVRALVIAAVFVSSFAYADSFDVQIGAFRNPDVARISFPDEIGELRSTSGPDGLTRFVVGPFGTRAEAERARDQLQGAGYSGAFIRSSGERRVVVQQSYSVSDSYSASDSQAEVQRDTQVSTSEMSDQEGEVVMLDGRPHRKVGDQFFPIRR
jgi:hypothetical protein